MSYMAENTFSNFPYAQYKKNKRYIKDHLLLRSQKHSKLQD